MESYLTIYTDLYIRDSFPGKTILFVYDDGNYGMGGFILCQ
jgi:hypothetical protein